MKTLAECRTLANEVLRKKAEYESECGKPRAAPLYFDVYAINEAIPALAAAVLDLCDRVEGREEMCVFRRKENETLLSERDAALAHVAELERDAARLQFLIDDEMVFYPLRTPDNPLTDPRARIDVAMEGKQHA